MSALVSAPGSVRPVRPAGPAVAETHPLSTRPDGRVFHAHSTVMSADDVRRALVRIAHEIVEKNQGSDGIVIVGLAALRLSVRRYRSLAAFRWLLLIAAVLFLLANATDLARPRPEKEVEEWQMTEWKSDDGLVALSVPGTWVSKPGGRQIADLSLDLVSMRGSFAVNEMHAPVSRTVSARSFIRKP